MGITRVQLFQIELKPVRKVSGDANLKRFQHKIFHLKKNPTLNMGEFAQTVRWQCVTIVTLDACFVAVDLFKL